MDKSIFETLNAINVGEHIEKKNGLSYLSWALAWGELKKRFPSATYQIYENENGFPYFNDGRTCWVKTGVTIEGLEHIEYLPIMDFKNKSIPVDQVTSTDINKAIQRSLTKAIARHGLGLYIYAGEDLPEEETIKANEELNKKIAKKEADTLAKILNEKQMAWVLDTYHVNTLQELTCGQYGELMRTINERAANGK